MFRDRYPVLIILFISTLIHVPVVFGIVDFYSGDGSDLIPYFYGSKLFLYQAFQEFNKIPLWNPYVMFGQPIVGNIQYALFYPLNLVFILLPFFKALLINQFIHLTIAGVGAYFLAIHTGCKRNGAVVAGCLYMLNGRILYYINAGWLGYFNSICWLPVFVLSAMMVIEKKERHYPVIMGIIFAMTFLCGTPQYAFMGFCLFFLQGVWRFFFSKSKEERLSLLVRMLLSGLVSFLLISIQLFPAIEQASLSSRIFSDSVPAGFHLDWNLKQWVRILLRPEFLSHDFAWELCAYIGAGGLLLAVAGFFFSGKRFSHHVIIWGVIPWLASMGPAFPPFDYIMQKIPGMSILTSPSRYFIFSILMLCVSAGYGVDVLFRSQGSKKFHIFILLTGLTLIFITLLVSPYSGSRIIQNARFLGIIAVFFLVSALFFRQSSIFLKIFFTCLLVIDPLLVSSPLLKGYHAKDLNPPVRVIHAIKDYPLQSRIAAIQPDGLRNNLLTPFEDWFCLKYGIGRADGYEPLAMLHTLRFLSQMDRTPLISEALWGFRLFSFARPELFDIAGITHIITFKPLESSRLKFIIKDTITMPNFHGGWWKEEPVYLYENKNVLPMAFFIIPGSKENVLPVLLKHLSPDSRYLYFRSKTPGQVVISESFHPGWTARENGRPVLLRPFLDNFISFDVPAGEHEIMLDFSPESFYLGLNFTRAGLVLVLLILLYQKWVNRREKIPTVNTKKYSTR